MVRPVLDKSNLNTGIKSTGFNQWDGEVKEGYGILIETGVEVINSARKCSKYIKVLPNTEYYETMSTDVIFYTDDFTYISYKNPSNSQTFTTPSNCCYIRLMFAITAVLDDFCINISDSSRNGTYEPYKESVLDLGFIHELKDENGNKYFPYGLLSAGDVYDEAYEGYAVKRPDRVDLGDLTWDRNTENTDAFFTANISDIAKKQLDEAVNLISSLYTVYPTAIDSASFGSTSVADKTVGLSDNDTVLFVKDSSYTDAAAFKAAMSGVELIYELAEPITIEYDKKSLSYPVDDLGTETLLPVNGTLPINAPCIGEVVYKSNFKDAVLDLIDRVNNYKNPVRGVNDTPQTSGKIAVYDSSDTTKSSDYSVHSGTIVTTDTTNAYELPTIAQLIAYVQTITASALHYMGTVASWSALPSSGQSTGDLYVFSAEDSTHTPPVNIGDFAIWNGSSWDLIQGKVSVVNNNPTLVMNGSTSTIGTVEGISLQVTTPNLNFSYAGTPTDTSDFNFVDDVSQTNGLISVSKKHIPDATTSNKGVTQFVSDIHNSTDTTKTATAKQIWDEFVKRNTKFVESSTIPSYTTKYGYLQDPENASSLLLFYSGIINNTTNHKITFPDNTEVNIPWYSNKVFYFGSNSFALLTLVDALLASTSSSTTNITQDTSNPYMLFREQTAGETNYTTYKYFQIKGAVETINNSDFGISVVGKSDNTINIGLTGVDDLKAIEALTGTSGYLKKTAANTWELDPYGGSSVESVYSDGASITTTTTASAGLKKAGATPTYQKISTSALVNDTVDILILNGNFS